MDARADLVFNFDDPYTRETIGGGTRELAESNLDAQRLEPIRILQRGEVRITGVRFRLGGLAPFARVPLAAWTGLTPHPRLVLGDEAAELEARLARARDPDTAAALLDGFFLDRLVDDPARAAVRRALDGIHASNGAAPVSVLAGTAGVAERQLERLFARHVGIPPKTVSRVVRFQTALRALMVDPGSSLGEVAAACGYYDQAHFVREFRRFSGGVPRGYRGYYPPQSPHDFAPNVVVFVQDDDGRVS